MGLILDTSILIKMERLGGTVDDILRQARASHGNIEIALSSVSVVELTHGIYRARTAADRERRRIFAAKAFHDRDSQHPPLPTHPKPEHRDAQPTALIAILVPGRPSHHCTSPHPPIH